tara:strand:+ start:393 stop:728 length:336 start_codon:yes stop_codon:yes gene_type:complete
MSNAPESDTSKPPEAAQNALDALAEGTLAAAAVSKLNADGIKWFEEQVRKHLTGSAIDALYRAVAHVQMKTRHAKPSNAVPYIFGFGIENFFLKITYKARSNEKKKRSNKK